MSNIKEPQQDVVSIEDAENYSAQESSFAATRFRSADDEERSIATSGEKVAASTKQPWREVFMLSFSSLGAIYGDIGTSPLYVLNSIKYKENPPNVEDIYGGISVVFYVFTIIVIFKYVLIVLFLGPNNGEGGQVAIYAKIARVMKIGPKGVHIPGMPEVSDLELLSRQDTTASYRSNKTFVSFKNHPMVIKCVQWFILVACFLGCSLVISDGLLTPTTSVLSAIGGIKIAQPSFSNVLAVSEVILVALFVIQQFGSHKISFIFAPIIFLWLIGLVICGLYNIVRFQPGIFKALSPYYAIKILKNGGIDVFSGAMLAITGTEAMFADIGHFGRLPIQLTLTCFVYPALIICYLGQGAYIVVHPEAITSPFFLSIPGGSGSVTYWIMFVLATLSTIIASQALILSVFSIVSQLINLDCFPNLKIVHVSKHYAGKVYIPTVNWLLMIGVCATTAGFKNGNNVTSAYGLGISLDFLVTSCLIVLCMIYVYNFNVLWALLFFMVFIPLEIIIVVSNIKKVPHGAWFPILMAGLFFIFLSVWRWARSKKVNHEIRARVKVDALYPTYKKVPVTVDLNEAQNREDHEIHENYQHFLDSKSIKVDSKFGVTSLVTHEGVGIMYNDSAMYNLNSPNTLPECYAKMISSFSSIPSVFIFCTTRVLSIPTVPIDERVLIAAMKIPGHFRCIVRFGFMEHVVIDKSLNNHILNSIPEYLELSARLKTESEVPIVHIFENNLIRCHDYSAEIYQTRNPFVKVQRFLRMLTINHFFSPITSLTQQHGQFVLLADEAEETEKKLFIGGVERI